MPLFSLRKAFTPRKGSSGGENFLRLMLLVLVFVGVGYLYTRHFDRTIELIEARQSVWDQTGTLTKAQKKVFRNFARLLKDEFGLECKFHAASGPVRVPVLDSKTLFFGLDTKGEQVVVEFPPLVRKALGREFMSYLQTEHFPRYFESGNWPKGLAEALKMVWEHLVHVDKAGETKDDRS